MRQSVLIAAIALAAGLAWPVSSMACSPPAPLPEQKAADLADAIVVGEGRFSEREQGGTLKPVRVLKGPRDRDFILSIDYKWVGPTGAGCPPINALKGNHRGTFYLKRAGQKYFIIKYIPEAS